MKLDLTPELAQLIKFAANTATAIRKYSRYSSERPSNGDGPRDPEMAPVDLMFLSDAVTQLLGVGWAIEQGDFARLSYECRYVQELFESYATDSPEFSPQAKPTFDYWASNVDLGIAVKALKAIQGKLPLPAVA